MKIHTKGIEMTFKVVGTILGFDTTKEVEILEIDELFATMKDCDNENITFTLANPYALREYSFDVPTDVRVILEMSETSKVSVYNIMVIRDPLETSTVNFIAPIIVNHDNNKLAQVVLDQKKYPDFGMAETLKSFVEDK